MLQLMFGYFSHIEEQTLGQNAGGLKAQITQVSSSTDTQELPITKSATQRKLFTTQTVLTLQQLSVVSGQMQS
jgi:hypothetical protein